MKRPLGSINSSRNKKIACTVSAAALMLGVSSGATIGLHFMENYCGSPAYSGYPVTFTAFGIESNGWENLLEMNTGYSSCGGPLGYTLNEVIDTTTSTNGLNPLPNGSLNVTWFGPTANFCPFGGYAGSPPNYYTHGGPLSHPLSGEEEIYATFIRDGINFGPPGGPNNDQPGYSVDITGLKSLFTNSSFVVELMASGDSIETLTNAMVIDVTDSLTNFVAYTNTPPVVNSEGSSYYQGTGGGLSTGSGPLNTDHIQIMSVQPVHVAGQYNHAGTISGFIITDKPVVSMYPQSVPVAGPGDTITLNPYVIGVPPLAYQWQLNGQNIAGATSSSYAISNFNLAAAGSYDVVVTNQYGAATSQVSTITPDRITQSPTNGIVYDSNPDNGQHDGVNMGASWIASNSDGTITRTGVMSFTATNTNGITVADSASFDGPTGTITFWMQSAGTDTNDPGNGNFGVSLFSRPNSAGSFDGFALVQQVGSPGNLTFVAPDFDNNLTSAKGVSDGKWHFVAVTFDQSATGGAAWFIDGALDSTNANGAAWTWPSAPLEIGYTTDSYFGDYNGLLNDFQYYSAILSASQIATLHTSGGLVDASALQLQFNFAAAPGGGTVLTWRESTAVLQSAPTVTGPWTDLPGASSPYTIVPAETQQFFRYRYVPQSVVSNPYLM
jgi:hypothetical protein